MNTAKHILTAICAAIALWLMILAGGLIYAMFSTTGDIKQRTDALWGAVYFQTTPSSNGVTMHLGVGNMQVVLLLLIASIIFCTIAVFIASVYKRKKVFVSVDNDSVLDEG
ncbi:hypothetical protein FHX77_000512 [Bifidobacterium commune]|uniref:Uncharacterized protein n=1 Tax=Bifidobacterium commune TaxID=1505727 RepID=A0A1C4H4T2_9BIFI|nr:hypothetical protein [Bifidobacterium commune]MBB2955132.1 hypothetical protein [Bifidobacterium commune]SCC79668.1 hypothetical protein GA0061077_0770 [Bifidobacterium commune]